jgi:hypothetical protein
MCLVAYWGALNMILLAWLLCFQASESMEMNQSQEPTSDDLHALSVPPVHEEIGDGLQEEVIDNIYVIYVW